MPTKVVSIHRWPPAQSPPGSACARASADVRAPSLIGRVKGLRHQGQRTLGPDLW